MIELNPDTPAENSEELLGQIVVKPDRDDPLEDRHPSIETRPWARHHKKWRRPESDPVKIAFAQTVYRRVMAHSIRGGNHEVGGVLLGHVHRWKGDYYVEVWHSLEAKHALEDHTELTLTADDWRAFQEEIQEDETLREYKIVGWYHTHPGHGVFFSGDDEVVHQTFSQPWMIALVVDHKKHQGWFWIKDGRGVWEASGYYELYDHKGRKRKSIIDWKKHRREQTGPPTPLGRQARPNNKWLIIAGVSILAAWILATLITPKMKISKEAEGLAQELGLIDIPAHKDEVIKEALMFSSHATLHDANSPEFRGFVLNGDQCHLYTSFQHPDRVMVQALCHATDGGGWTYGWLNADAFDDLDTTVLQSAGSYE